MLMLLLLLLLWLLLRLLLAIVVMVLLLPIPDAPIRATPRPSAHYSPVAMLARAAPAAA
jgi:hypothetical protein